MTYLITGASGHLGSTIIKELKKDPSNRIYGLVMKGENFPLDENVMYFNGDITDKHSLISFFASCPSEGSIVIHTAGLVSIEDDISPLLFNVNVEGTLNIIKMCKKFNVARLVYISSVDALGEEKNEEGIIEEREFSTTNIRGGYAYTKALSSSYVIKEAREKNLDALVIMPSCILGPRDTLKNNHLNQFVRSLIKKRVPISIEGGFDFVDVRDVALGVIKASVSGKSGESYILSNRYYSVDELEECVCGIVGGHKKPTISLKTISFFIPIVGFFSKLFRTKNLLTKYSLHTLGTHLLFSHEKATRELAFHPRPLRDTIIDMKTEMESTKK